MQKTADTRLRVLDSTIATAAAVGLSELTIGSVATAAGVSSALVHYHFDTKQALIVAAAERAVGEDVSTMTAALADGQGLGTLDHLWDALQKRAGSGRATFGIELRLHAVRAPGLAAVVVRGTDALAEAIGKRLPALLRELGSRLAEPREEIAAVAAAFLDGLALALAGGRPAGEVRAAYDAFWLTLIAAGQDARRR